jgi:hypothetical protein
VLLGLGAVPAAAVVYLRRKMPESPRYEAQAADAAADIDTVFQAFGLRGTLMLTAGVSVLGALLTLVLPEPAGPQPRRDQRRP